MNERLQRDIDAYRDGGLSARRRSRVEQAVEGDREAQAYLRSGALLSQLVRAAWLEGPPSPPADRFLAAIRPELQRIDAERARRARARVEDRWSWLRWSLLPAAGAAAAATLVAVTSVWSPQDPSLPKDFRPEPPMAFSDVARPEGPQEPAGAPAEFGTLVSTGAPASEGARPAVYDLYQGDDSAVLIYDGEDQTPLVIFALPDPDYGG